MVLTKEKDMKAFNWYGTWMVIAVVVVILILGSCVPVNTIGERCLFYRTAIETAKALPPGLERDQRIKLYEALISQACAPTKGV